MAREEVPGPVDNMFESLPVVASSRPRTVESVNPQVTELFERVVSVYAAFGTRAPVFKHALLAEIAVV